jgi:hypothetical protein
MFITDTADAVYRTDDSKPESLMDRLTNVLSDMPQVKVGAFSLTPLELVRLTSL